MVVLDSAYRQTPFYPNGDYQQYLPAVLSYFSTSQSSCNLFLFNLVIKEALQGVITKI